MQIEWVESYSEFQALKTAWNALAQWPGQDGGVFARHEWFDAAWQWSADHAHLKILVARADDALVAVLPLMCVAERKYSVSLRTLRFLTVPDTQRCDIVCAPPLAQAAGRALAEALLARQQEWDVLALDFAPVDAPALSALLSHLQEQGLHYHRESYGTNWSIDVRGAWDLYYNTRARALKKANNLVDNRLQQAGQVGLQWQRAGCLPTSADTVMTQVAQVSTASWKSGNGNALDHPGPRRFLQRLTEHALREQWLSLWLLTLNGRLVAYEYQLQYQGRVHALRADVVEGLDASLSPGSWLHFNQLQQLFADAASQLYCMGPGGNTYKLKWTEGGEVLLRHIVAGRSWRARWYALLEWKIKPPLRTLRDRYVAKPSPEGRGADDNPLPPGEGGAKRRVREHRKALMRRLNPWLVRQPVPADGAADKENSDAIQNELKPNHVLPANVPPANVSPAKKIVSRMSTSEIPTVPSDSKQGWVGLIQPGQDSAALRAQLPRMAQPLSNNAAAPLLSIAEQNTPGMALGWTAHTVVGHAKGQWGECFIWGRPHLRSRAPEAVCSARDLNQAANILERKLGSEGAAAFDVLRGSFSIVAVSHDRQHIFLAVDPMGMGRLNYAQIRDQVWVATRSDSIAPVLPHATLNPQALYNYVFFHAVGAPHTMHREIHQVPAGCAVHLHGGKAHTTRYWNFNFSEDAHDFTALKQEFISTLQAVHQPYAQAQHIGTFLSGGTDSSTVCGMLGRVSGTPATSYSIGFAAEGYDEIGFAASAARHFGAEHRIYYVTPEDVVNTIDTVARTYDQPFGNASAVPVYWCAKRAAEDGMRMLLAGDGGDELFGGNSRYATQWLFSHFENLPAPLRRLARAAANKTPDGLSVISKAASYVRQASIPMPERMHTYNLIERIGAHTIFAPELLSQIDVMQPYAEQRAIYQSTPGNSLINRMLWLDWKTTLADSDLPKVNGMCEAAGMQVAYPFLDDRIIEFSARLAPDLKLRRTYLRYFFKKALWDFLPQSTLTKSKQGFGLPFGVWLTHHAPLRERAYESLRSLDRRGLLADGFIKHLLAQHQGGHAGYYGTLIWVLMMLEGWFEKSETR